MTDLTEQWKKGELPEGWYYVKGNRVEGIYAYTAEYLNNMYRPRNGERTIAKVPSYEEYQKLLSDQLAKIEGEEINAKLKSEYEKECHRADELEDSYWKAEKENARLKEILKECQHILNEQNFYRNTPVETDATYRTRCLKKEELLKRIDEVLK